MKKLQLLDCTLRDGGYVNDWDFGFGSIKSIFSRLDSAGVDIIEVGFIDERRAYDENRSIYPNVKAISPVFAHLRKPQAMVVAMIDYGTCSIDRICPQSESSLDGIRVIFKKKDQDKAVHYISEVMGKGYKVFANPVSITSYNDDELEGLIDKINSIKPFAVTVVDTYGLMHSDELFHYFDLYDENLSPDIMLAYHGHNNFQMAYVNLIVFINHQINRPLIIDGTLFGMGKSAGNACLELLAMYMNEKKGRNFDICQIQEAIDSDIEREYAKHPWGYNIEYYIAALNDCHPTYVQFLRKKGSLSIKSINEILRQIPRENKLSFDEKLIENLYCEYQTNTINDSLDRAQLRGILDSKKILLLGPGTSISEYEARVDRFIVQEEPIVISINFLHQHFPIDYVFMSNSKRYSQFFDKIYGETSGAKIICTSNITKAGNKVDYTINYCSLLAEEKCIRDNPLILFLHLLDQLDIHEVYLAGFDGYVEGTVKNYYSAYVPYLYCQEDVLLRNDAIKKELISLKRNMSIQFITPTRYI